MLCEFANLSGTYGENIAALSGWGFAAEPTAE
jgi:hypothetical protein